MADQNQPSIVEFTKAIHEACTNDEDMDLGGACLVNRYLGGCAESAELVAPEDGPSRLHLGKCLTVCHANSMLNGAE